MADDVPGDVTYWLKRASLSDLHRRRASEVEKNPLTVSWRLVVEIDEELQRREKLLRAGLGGQ